MKYGWGAESNRRHDSSLFLVVMVGHYSGEMVIDAIGFATLCCNGWPPITKEMEALITGFDINIPTALGAISPPRSAPTAPARFERLSSSPRNTRCENCIAIAWEVLTALTHGFLAFSRTATRIPKRWRVTAPRGLPSPRTLSISTLSHPSKLLTGTALSTRNFERSRPRQLSARALSIPR